MYAEGKEENLKEFLKVISAMIGQLESQGTFESDIVEKMKEQYLYLNQKEQKDVIQILDELLQEDCRAYFSFMSTLLEETKDARILPYLKEKLTDQNYPLWERYSNMHQLKMYLFRNQTLYWDEQQEYKISREIYENILREIQETIGASYPYLSYASRKKTIVITVIQLLGEAHAPTRKVIDFYRFFEAFGYTVKVFVCFHPGKTDGNSIFWYAPLEVNNFINKTTLFQYDTGREKIKGYNLKLEPKNYIQGLREAVGMIWDEKPEFLFEIGEETMLAGLCSHFTTVVTIGLTKSVPVTTAPVIARFFDYSQEENERFQSFLEEGQQIIDVKHYVDPLDSSDDKREKKIGQRQELGISEDDFVIIIAGNRLDLEVTDKFWNILEKILEKDAHFSILVIGECPEFNAKAVKSIYAERIFFSGFTRKFQELIAVGDVFLNPPRQGGGTGAAYALLKEIPVITLGHCDVESSVGKNFVCDSLEEMPELILRYLSDQEFMEQQKEFCRKRVEEKRNVDSMGNFRKLFHLVETTARRREEVNET